MVIFLGKILKYVDGDILGFAPIVSPLFFFIKVSTDLFPYHFAQNRPLGGFFFFMHQFSIHIFDPTLSNQVNLVNLSSL